MPRTMKKGDTWPVFRGEAAGETGQPLDLSGADSMEMIAVGATHTISGPATALWPAVPDDDGIHKWNWECDIAVGDTDIEDTYEVRLVVTWAPGQVQTFPNTGHDELTIEAP